MSLMRKDWTVDNLTLKIQREMTEPCRAKLTIEVPVEIVQRNFAKVYGEFKQHGRIPGFRPGKTPDALLRRHFGSRLTDEAQRELIRETTNEAVKQEKMQPETQPRLENPEALKYDEKAAFTYTVSFDVAPSVTLPDYRTFDIQKPEAAVSEATVDETVQEWIQRRAGFQTVDRAAQAGDMLKVGWKATLAEPLAEGEAVPEQSKYILENADGWLILKSPEIIPGAAVAMVGAKAGDEKTFPVTFPADYFVKALAGRKASYVVNVKEVQAPEQVQLTDEVAAQYGHKTAAEMRTAVAGYLERESQYKQRESMRRELVEKLMQAPEFPLPPAILARQEIDVFVRLFNEELRAGRKEGEVQAEQEKLMAKAKGIARQELRRRYLIQALADAEKVQVSYEELSNAVVTMARMQHVAPKTLYRQLDESGRLGALFDHLRENKTLEHLTTVCKINGKEQAPAAAPAKA